MKNESGTVESQDTTLNFDFIVSFAQMGSNSMFTILACTLYTHYRRSTLFLGQQENLTNPYASNVIFIVYL